MKRYLFDGICLQNARAVNMDSLLLKSRQIRAKSACIAVVCDGVGSLADGAFAARVAVRELYQWFDKLKTLKNIGLQLRDEVLRISAEISGQAAAHDYDTASTISALLLIESSYFIVHAGDSRIYRYHGGVLEQLTFDDVSAAGKLTKYIGRGRHEPRAAVVPRHRGYRV